MAEIKTKTNIGIRRYWTPERENALIALGHAANTGKEHLDWAHASAQLPKERKILCDKTNTQLSKMYLRTLKSKIGRCQRPGCNEPAEDGGRVCREHRIEAVKRASEIIDPLSIQEINENYEIFLSVMEKHPKEELIDFIHKNFWKIPHEERKKLLDPEFSKRIKRGKL